MYIFKNANIVTTSETYIADVLVENGKISQIATSIINDNAEVIYLDGKYLLPGGIDVHTHMELPFGGTVSSDDFEFGTKAAAFGGITTIIDFAIQPKGKTLAETLKERRKLADEKVVIDYGLHMAITDLTNDVMDEMVDIINNGCPTFKLFMTYDFAVDDITLFNALKKAEENGGMIGVHAENKNLITNNIERLLEEGKTEPMYHEVSREDYVEAEAVSRASMWANETNSKLYVVHLSSAKGLEEIKSTRLKGTKVLCETCPQYLVLTKEKYKEPNFGGAKYVMSPPLRSECDNKILWEGLANGDIQIVGSDHCPFTLEDKKLGKDRFDKIPNGAPGVETSLMILHSEGVLKNKISINKMVEVLSYNPAKIFGLKDKGSIQVGKDADLVVFDPNQKRTLSHKNLHTQNDYSVYEGLEVTGVPTLTMSKGKIICKDDIFLGSKGDGKYIKRTLD